MLIVCLLLSIRLISKTKDRNEELQRQQEKINVLRKELTSISQNVEQSNAKLQSLNNELAVAEQKRQGILQLIQAEENRLKVQKENAAEIAKQQMDLEVEKLKVDLQNQLTELQKNSPLEAYKKELEEAQKKIEVLHQQQAKELEKEDFYAAHSIELSDADKADIALLQSLSGQLSHRDALNKLIWTEYIQKPIQALCKNLDAEKVCGIYKITNKENDMVYIGQAVDIADRWKQHCKTALGIGSLSYLTNKFYKTMNKEGIDKFSFEILEQCKKDELDSREIYYIDFYGVVKYGYNGKRGN